MPIITLTTDFGLKDGNVGVMKGVIWGICPQAQIADLSHLITPQNIREAALILARSAPYFPKGSIHVVVVDPGVGTERRPMVARIGDWFYVGPDNGTITMLLEYGEQEDWEIELVHLNKPGFWLPEVSHVFHGRDIFSPVAAHLANSVPFRELGMTINDPVRLELPKPKRTSAGWLGEIIHIDHFGNLVSNIRIEHLGDILNNKQDITVKLCDTKMDGVVNTFGERPEGELIALFGSNGNLIVSVVNGNAAVRLNARIGVNIEVILP